MTNIDNQWTIFFKKHRDILFLFCILFANFLAYIPAMKGGFIWDDPMHVTENELLKNADGLRKIWFEPGAWPQYYPLLLTSFWVEYQLWGLAPFHYHFINVLLHVLNALLLWRALRFLKVPGAMMAAAVFALHPVNVESVAWISERKNVLSGLFYLSALIFYLRFSLPDSYPGKLTAESEKTSSSKNSIRFYVLSMIFFLLALLSKTITCSLPAALLLLLWWKKGRIEWCDIKFLIPMFLIGFVLGINTIHMETQAGAQGAEWAFSFLDRILIAGRALCFYAEKLILPINLTFIYPRWEINSGIWWQYCFPLAAGIIIVLLWVFRKRIGRGPIVAVLFFSGTLLPALGFFNVYPHRFSFVADHFQYLASIGLISLVVSMATRFNAWYPEVGSVIFLRMIRDRRMRKTTTPARRFKGME